MELGTHNSMTYLPLKKWWMYPFNWIAKCLDLAIEDLYNLGVRLFDIRISFDKNNIPEFRHGLISYKGDVYKTLEWLNHKNELVKIRILLEETKESPNQEVNFIKYVNHFRSSFKNLAFYEGRRKYDWKQLMDLPTLDINQLVGSMSGNKFYEICPKLYAKKYNKMNLRLYLDNRPLLIDFIK